MTKDGLQPLGPCQGKFFRQQLRLFLRGSHDAQTFKSTARNCSEIPILQLVNLIQHSDTSIYNHWKIWNVGQIAGLMQSETCGINNLLKLGSNVAVLCNERLQVHDARQNNLTLAPVCRGHVVNQRIKQLIEIIQGIANPHREWLELCRWEMHSSKAELWGQEEAQSSLNFFTSFQVAFVRPLPQIPAEL